MEKKYQQWRTRSRVAGKLPFGMILALMPGDNSIPAVDASGCTGCNGREAVVSLRLRELPFRSRAALTNWVWVNMCY